MSKDYNQFKINHLSAKALGGLDFAKKELYNISMKQGDKIFKRRMMYIIGAIREAQQNIENACKEL